MPTHRPSTATALAWARLRAFTLIVRGCLLAVMVSVSGWHHIPTEGLMLPFIELDTIDPHSQPQEEKALCEVV